jgi:hypothetical protein
MQARAYATASYHKSGGDEIMEPKKLNRKTNEERATELVSTGALKPRLIDEHGLSVYIGVSTNTLQNARGKLPQKWTLENLKAEMAKGLISPPVTMVGGKKMYDLILVDKWIDMLPVLGQLPE